MYRPWLIMFQRGVRFSILGTLEEAEDAAINFLQELAPHTQRRLGPPVIAETSAPETENTFRAVITDSWGISCRIVDVYENGIGNSATTEILPYTLARGEPDQRGKFVRQVFKGGRIFNYFRPTLES